MNQGPQAIGRARNSPAAFFAGYNHMSWCEKLVAAITIDRIGMTSNAAITFVGVWLPVI